MGRIPPNVLKLRKQKRQGRRAYLTSQYSTIYVPRSVGKSSIPDDSRPLFDYRSRVETPGNVRFLNAIMPYFSEEEMRRWDKEEHAKKAKEWEQALNPKSHNLQKLFALQREEEERLVNLITDPDVCDYITMRNSLAKRSRLTFVYNRQYTRCYFVEIFYLDEESYAMKSKVYGGKDRAIFDMNNHRIVWAERVELSSLSLVLPRRG